MQEFLKSEDLIIMSKKGNYPIEIEKRLHLLSERELRYFMSMWPKSGVLYITSRPGIAKSAIMRSITKKIRFHYDDIRLSMSDEVDFKFPFLKDCEYDGNIFKVSGYAVPEWAFLANTRPTLIHFEELNRAPQFVRNAALQILLERQIGNFKFNDNVIMCASGNLGDEDGTDVEEFDAALNNRLIHYTHTLTHEEWLQEFANDNVHRIITSYIRAYPERMIQDPTENSKAYATPRSWTFLSDMIISNFGKDSSPREFLPHLMHMAPSYIGPGAQRFLAYCQDMINISINDIINNYDNIKKELDKYNRDKNSELIMSLKDIDISTLNDFQTSNVVKFLKRVSSDELMAYLVHVIDEMEDTSQDKIRNFLLNFEDQLVNLRRINDPNKKY